MLSCSYIWADDHIIGIYHFTDTSSEEETKVKIFKTTDGVYNAQVVWLAHPYNDDGSLKLDVNNPNPNLRKTPGCEIILIKNLTYNVTKNQWESKELYHPTFGRYFSVYMRFETPTKLKVRGYLGKPAFGQTIYWDKLEE